MTGRELAELIMAQPEWFDLPVHILAMDDNVTLLTGVERDCFDPAEGSVLSLVAEWVAS